MKLNIVEISDIHFGSKASDRLSEELNLFLDYVKNNKVDLVVINGDIADRKLSFQPMEKAAINLITFYTKLCEICRNNKISLRLISGTKSHDNDIATLLNSITEKDFDFKSIETAQEENLLNIDIIYLPEEYPMNVKEFYNDRFLTENKHYDIAFGHGTWDKAFELSGMINDNDNNDIRKAPVFIWDEWKNFVNLVCFGHLHQRIQYKDAGILKIFYASSFTSWNFNNTTACGFSHIIYDTDSKKYKVKFIDNLKAPVYQSIKFSELGIDASKDIEEIKLDIDKFKKENNIDYLKINLDNIESASQKLLTKIFDGKNNTYAEITSKAKKLLQEKADTSALQKYEYIVKESMPIEEIIHKFIKEEYEKDVDLEYIKEVLKEC